MDLDTFFFCRAGGSSTMFEVRELPSDTAVADYAAAMLREHACAYSAARRGERPVLTRHRGPPGGAFAPANDAAAHL